MLALEDTEAYKTGPASALMELKVCCGDLGKHGLHTPLFNHNPVKSSEHKTYRMPRSHMVGDLI